MAYLRKLPSGKWQATIRGADGKKHTKTDPLKKVVKDWAAEEESKVAQGRWRDPRRGMQTVGEYAEAWFGGRVVEDETRRGDRGVMDNHILAHWRTWRLNAITKLDVQNWARTMQKAGTGAHAIRRAFNLFSVMLEDAVDAEVIAENPCRAGRRRKVGLPATPPKLPAWFTREQVDLIRHKLEHPTRAWKYGATRPHRGHSVMVELMCCVGLRFGEAAAVCGGERPDGNPIDWLRGRVRIDGVLTQNGRWKEYPKTSKSRGDVPIPSHLLAELGELLVGRERTARLFVSPRSGSNLSGSNWRKVWYAAIDDLNAERKAARLEPVPRIDPHDCRHTAASWLAQAGVPLYEIQALLRHESSRTTERYAHLAPDSHARVEDAWVKILAHQRRTALPSRTTDTG